jgi:hypothetical protein
MKPYRFDPVDIEQMRLLGQLPSGSRIQVMLDAREGDRALSMEW